jgi:acyl carrier protein
MNEQEFLKLLNAVAKIAKPFSNEYVDATLMSDKFVDSGLDSLDMLLTSTYMCDAFCVNEEVGKTMQVSSVQEMYDFLMLNKTKMPATAEEALKDIQ